MSIKQAIEALPQLPAAKTLSRGDEDGAIQLGYTADQMREYALSALRSMKAGWAIVPVEPTEEMISAGFKHVYHPTMENDMEHVWSAMIAACLSAQTDPLEKLTRTQEELGLYDDMGAPAQKDQAP